MPDPMTPIILDTIASHLRRCAVLVDDAPSVDFVMTAAHQLEDRAEELRDDALRAARVEPETLPPA